MNTVWKAAAWCVTVAGLVAGCAGATNIPNADEQTSVARIRSEREVNVEVAQEILDAYTLAFTIPNPFINDTQISPGSFDPSHRSTIECTAVLLDDVASRADMLVKCREDSLDGAAADACREHYRRERLREGMFRIRLSMESGFSEKSMDADHWAIYLVNDEGIMIEPNDIREWEVHSVRDTVYSRIHDLSRERHLLNKDITLYFNRVTFFGDELLGENSDYLILVISREQATLARVGWRLKLPADARN